MYFVIIVGTRKICSSEKHKMYCGRTFYTHTCFNNHLALFPRQATWNLYFYSRNMTLTNSQFICCLVPPSLCASILSSLISPFSEGEESSGFVKASVRSCSQEETSLAPVVPTHPRPLNACPRCRGHWPHSPSSLPSPSRPLRFLSNGVTGASWFLSNWERDGGSDGTGASAQEVRFTGHQLPHVAPSNTRWQPSDGPPSWTQTPVQRKVDTHTHTDIRHR